MSTPEKPMNAMANKPAVTKAMAIPSIPFGMFTKLNCSLIAYGLLRDLASGLLITYIVVLFSFIYYCSLIFYVLEINVNPQLHSFWDSLWYSCMTATTAGCNISAITTVGKVISVFLALAGMMLLPVFTVYLTDLIRTGHVHGGVEESQMSSKQ